MKRAVMEGAALHLALMMKQLEEISGKEAPKKATISGGASKSKLVCQIMADVMNCEMLNINVSDEVGSLGAAICAGVGVGILKTSLLPTSLWRSPGRQNRFRKT